MMACPSCGMIACPLCHGVTVANGRNTSGNAQRRCTACNHGFVPAPRIRRPPTETMVLLANLLAAGVTVPVLARASGLDQSRLYRMRRRLVSDD